MREFPFEIAFTYEGDPAYADVVTAIRVKLPFQDGLWTGEDYFAEDPDWIEY